MTVSGLDTATEKIILSVLYGSLGANEAGIASEFTDAISTFDDSSIRLTERFGERQSFIDVCTKFNSRFHQENLNIFDFVTKLKRLATFCNYRAVKLENVPDRLVAGCLDNKDRERLFQEPADLTLENVVVFPQTIKRASSESKRLGEAFRSHQPTALLQVNSTIRHKRSRTDRTLSFNRRRSFSRSLFQLRKRNNEPNCYYCGYKSNQRRDQCLADGHKCRIFGIRNHFEVCQSSIYH